MKHPAAMKINVDLRGLIWEDTQDILKEIKASCKPEWF